MYESTAAQRNGVQLPSPLKFDFEEWNKKVENAGISWLWKWAPIFYPAQGDILADRNWTLIIFYRSFINPHGTTYSLHLAIELFAGWGKGRARTASSSQLDCRIFVSHSKCTYFLQMSPRQCLWILFSVVPHWWQISISKHSNLLGTFQFKWKIH